MATIPPVTAYPDRGTMTITWSNIGDSDTCTAATGARWPDKTVSVRGTFSSATVVIQGSDDNSNWVPLNDSRGEGNSLSFSSADIRTVTENPTYIRPSSTGGSSSSTTVVLVCRAK